MDLRDQLVRFLNPLTNRLKSLLARGVIKRVNDKAKVQRLQCSLLAGELKDGLENYQQYGFTSVPLAGMETVALFSSGDRSNGVVVAVGDRQFRLNNLQNGEVALYTDEGDFVKLGRNQTISVSTKDLVATITGSAVINCPSVTIQGNLAVNGNITATGQVSDGASSMQAMRGVYNGHTHPETGSETSTPSSTM